MTKPTHECQFPEEETPEKVRILYPCLVCGYAPADALLALRAELDAADSQIRAMAQERGPQHD